MKVVEDAGTAFAFPTRTVHLVREPAPRPATPVEPAGAPPAPRTTAKPEDLPFADGD